MNFITATKEHLERLLVQWHESDQDSIDVEHEGDTIVRISRADCGKTRIAYTAAYQRFGEKALT